MTNDQEVIRVLRIQRISTLLGAVLIPVSIWLMFNALWPVAGLWWWVSFVVCSGFSLHIFKKIAFVAAVFFVTITSGDAALDEVDEEDLLEYCTIVDRPDESIGTYKGEDIYEWMDFSIETGEIKRADFAGTVDLDGNFSIKPGQIVVPPGLVYEYRQVNYE